MPFFVAFAGLFSSLFGLRLLLYRQYLFAEYF